MISPSERPTRACALDPSISLADDFPVVGSEIMSLNFAMILTCSDIAERYYALYAFY
jgi:hypothetical protein